MTFGSSQLTSYVDRTLGGPTDAHYHSFQRHSEPDLHYRQFSHVPRPLPGIALRLQDPRLKCAKNLGWSIDWAVAFIVDYLDTKNSPDAADNLKRIRHYAATLEKDGHAQEVPYRIFNKLDCTLFAGHLKNAVYLDIRRLGPNVSGATHSQGWGLDPKVKRVSINLNGHALQHARSCDIVAVLIHHMIHAYFLVACGPQQEKEVEYGRLNHGPHFGKIMATIKKLSTDDGRPLMSLGFGHSLGQARNYFEEYRNRPRRQMHHPRGREKWYCSHCYSEVEGIPEKELDKWYGKACKPLFDLPKVLRSSTVKIYNDRRHSLEEVPRGETTPSKASNEFIFQDQSVLVPSSKIENFPGIRHAFEKAGSRYLKVDRDVLIDTFERFLELLHTGTYGPDPKYILAMGKSGPPVIKSPIGSEPYLLMDIRIFKMGCQMGFDELKRIALDRMYRHSETHEDPVALLKEIYSGPEPNADLKRWVRKFLLQSPAAGDTEWMGMSSPRPGAEPSNLAKLECDMLGYNPRFQALLEQSSALKYEVSMAKKELFANGSYANAGMFGAMGMGAQRSWNPPMPLGPTLPMLGMAGRSSMLGLPWANPVPHGEMDFRTATAGEPFLGGRMPYEGFEGAGWPYD